MKLARLNSINIGIEFNEYYYADDNLINKLLELFENNKIDKSQIVIIENVSSIANLVSDEEHIFLG